MISEHLKIFVLTLGALVLCSSYASAQEAAVSVEENSQDAPRQEVVSDITRRVELWRPGVEPSRIPSLFFTTGEYNLIQEARIGFTARGGNIQEGIEGYQPPMGPREVLLSGIVYVSSKDWTLWLNGIRVTPEAMPSEILDVKVFKEHVDLKWFDAYTNQVFPIRLRAHQRFNLDSRIFLPG